MDVRDNPLSHVFRILRDDYRDVKTTIATREEEAFGIAAGLYLGGAKPTVMLQSSGLGNSLERTDLPPAALSDSSAHSDQHAW